MENVFGEPREHLEYDVKYDSEGKATVHEKRRILSHFQEFMELNKFPFDTQVVDYLLSILHRFIIFPSMRLHFFELLFSHAVADLENLSPQMAENSFNRHVSGIQSIFSSKRNIILNLLKLPFRITDHAIQFFMSSNKRAGSIGTAATVLCYVNLVMEKQTMKVMIVEF